MGQGELDITIDPRSVVPLYEQICQQIRQKIESRQLQPGASLPTNHEFCARLQISYTTAQQAMSTLAKEGYVTRQARRGTIVKGIPRRGVVGIYSYIELFGPHSKYEFYRLITTHLSRQLESNGRVYRMYLGSESSESGSTAEEDLLRHLSGGTLCGAILVNPPHQAEQIVRQGRAMRVPIVAMVGGCQTDYSAWTDYAGSIGAMARYLVQQGRKRVGIIFSRLSLSLRDPVQISKILEDAGCPPKSSWVVGRNDNEEGGYDAAAAMPFDEIDGLIVTDDMMVLGVDRRLTETGVRVPDQVLACTFWNHGSRLHLNQPFERFELDVEKLAHAGLTLLQDVIRGQRIADPHQRIGLTHVVGPAAGALAAGAGHRSARRAVDHVLNATESGRR